MTPTTPPYDPQRHPRMTPTTPRMTPTTPPPAAVPLQMVRDPRFDDLSGEYKPEIFNQTYSFLSDVRRKEKEVITKKLKKVKDPKRKQELEYLLQRMTHQDEAQHKKQLQQERLKELKRKQREQVHQGQKPYFLKKSEQRKLVLAEKYLELKKAGKLESFLGKKRKRNAIKDRRKMPGKKQR
ncbi:LOW QUALITY PROTEIN: ribosomal RNA processing protein 36 homolog [Heterodontus francisci]|uniref:LOW QUALITY PROTEIN: ribosomal RNA processing protein 36 homolog n=1 Tax=Heterodontus francisci TaxID=7792 RepID=UPI00355B3FC6